MLEITDLASTVTTLQQAGVHFRNDIVTGVGGKQILLNDPSGNPIELFQPTRPEASLTDHPTPTKPDRPPGERPTGPTQHPHEPIPTKDNGWRTSRRHAGNRRTGIVADSDPTPTSDSICLPRRRSLPCRTPKAQLLVRRRAGNPRPDCRSG